jgi:hypothetical protein
MINVEKISNRRSLWLGQQLLGPLLVVGSVSMMWFQATDFKERGGYFSIYLFIVWYYLSLVSIKFIKQCRERIITLDKVS